MPTSYQDRVSVLDNAVHRGPPRPRMGITLVVMHCTAGDSAMSSIHYLNATVDKVASYHYIIDRDGTIYRMLPVDQIAYHAGDSAFPANPSAAHQGHSVNARSIGIAFANRNDGEALTQQQLESGLWLCGLCVRGPLATVPVDHVVGHYEVSPHRKTDPEPATPMSLWRDRLTHYLETVP